MTGFLVQGRLTSDYGDSRKFCRNFTGPEIRDVKNLFTPEGIVDRGSGKSMNDTDPQIAKLVRRRLLERSAAERVLMSEIRTLFGLQAAQES